MTGPDGADAAPRVLVITPTYEERDNLPRFVERLFAEAPDVRLLVIDDHSPDGTADVARDLARAEDRIEVLVRPGKMGLGTAYVAGFRHALAEGFDVAVEMDADLSHDAAHLPALLQALASGADLAIGSRYVQGGGVIGWGLGRQALSQGGSLYARTILGVGVRDMTTGFKAYSRRALEAIDVPSLRCNGYAFQVETTYRALQAGLKAVEVPIVFVDRRVGESKLSGEVFLEAVTAVWAMRIRGQ